MKSRPFPHATLLVAVLGSLAAGRVVAQESKPLPAPGRPGIWIYLADADGGNRRLLTDLPEFPHQGSPCWSRDGKKIAFDALRPQKGEKDQDARIVVVNADGGNPRVLNDGAMPSLSPEGKRIAFSRHFPHAGVWVMSTEGPETELVLLDDRGWGTDWSPDGKKIAYAIHTENGANLVLFDVVEGNRLLLFPEKESPWTRIYWNFSWAPDSGKIVFRGQRTDGRHETAVVDARGASHGLTTVLTDNDWNWYAWRPDGARILTTRQPKDHKHPQIFSFKPGPGGAPERLPGQSPDFASLNAAWSPDGKKLLISSRQPAPPSESPRADAPK